MHAWQGWEAASKHEILFSDAVPKVIRAVEERLMRCEKCSAEVAGEVRTLQRENGALQAELAELRLGNATQRAAVTDLKARVALQFQVCAQNVENLLCANNSAFKS